MNIAIIGTGYVGLVMSACLADKGQRVFGVDNDEAKIKDLRQGKAPFFEEGLEGLLANELLSFETSLSDVGDIDVYFIAVGTPPLHDGQVDMKYVIRAAEDIAKHATPGSLVVTKSTVPVGTGKKIKMILGQDVNIASNPEFLREGRAVVDFNKPDRIVVGAESPVAFEKMREVYAWCDAPVIEMGIAAAELVKYASNAFLATKISFANEIANVCEEVGADVGEVMKGVGLDTRIGSGFLKAGCGYGGSCFPKDIRALHALAGQHDYDFKLLKSVIEVNQQQFERTFQKILNVCGGDVAGKKIGVLGLAFKPMTDYIRESIAVAMINKLVQAGAMVYSYDPLAMNNAKRAVDCEFTNSAEEIFAGADAVFLATEWPEFAELDWGSLKNKMSTPNIVDGRNLLDPDMMKSFGYKYISIGR